MSILPFRIALELSTFRSLNLSCNKLAPPEGVILPLELGFIRDGRWAEEPLLLLAGVILVLFEEEDSGRISGRDNRPLREP